MADFTDEDRQMIRSTHDKVILLAEAVKGLPTLWKRTEELQLEMTKVSVRQEDGRFNFWQGVAVFLSLAAIGAQAAQVLAK